MTGGGKPRRRINWLSLSSRPFLVLLPACLCASWIALQHHADLVLLDNAMGSSVTMALMVVPDEAPLLRNGHESFLNNNNATQWQRHHQPPSSRPASRSTKVLSSTSSSTTNSGNPSSDRVRESSLVHALLHQSLCDVESSFVKLLDANGPTTTTTATTVQTWAARLVYLAVYEHQNEVLLPSDDDDRSSSLSSSSSMVLLGDDDDKDDTMNTKDDGGGDDCTTMPHQNKTKFLVFAYGKSGLGANVRLGAVPALQLGLATNRRVININRAPFGPPFLQESWPWAASCSDQSRRRYRAECYFRPLTTLCWDPKWLDGAPILTKTEARYAFRTGRMPAALEDEQYLILHVTFRPQRDPETLRGIVASKACDVAERLRWTDSPSSATVREALDLIRAEPKLKDVGEYDYYGVNSVIFHGLLLYAMRPTTAVSLELKRILADVTKQFDESTVGVPIRASDKCGTESQCLAAKQYVGAALEASPFASSLFVTTEAIEVQEEISKLANDPSTPIRLLLNEHDVLPDTGFWSEPPSGDKTGHNDDVITAALSSLQAQLRTSLILGNCCSNFHLIMKDLVAIGCGVGGGVVDDQRFQCLQRHFNPDYRLCCSWDRHCSFVSAPTRT